MKRMKKLLVLVLSTLMLLGTMSITAFAEDPDSSISISGLNQGDVAKIYKIIKWSSTGWAWADGVETAAATAPAITLPNLDTIKGGQLNAAEGGTLAQVAQRLSAVTTLTAPASGTVKYDKPGSMQPNDFLGLYVALITPASPEYLYNPVFVAADFSAGNNSITLVKDQLSYSDTALAKKEEITVTKTATEYDVAVGEVIDFTIESIVPEFSSSYVDPMYEIEDTLETGLQMTTDPVVVQVKAAGGGGSYATLAASNYTLTPKASGAGFTLALKSAYLKGLTSAQNIKVTYKAKIVSIPNNNVVVKENKATVKFSNDPSNSSSYSLLEDKTYHYTFSIDANLLGNSDWENSELVKVGQNADGSPITAETLSNGTTASVLADAVFGLYTDQACTTLYTNPDTNPPTTGQFTSDQHGKLKISGLDAGVYYLKEIQAPEGYIADPNTYKIEITAHYTEVPGGTYVKDGVTVKYYPYDVLDSYSVKVTNLTTNQTVTSTFTITNPGPSMKSSATDVTSFLVNTKGTELPTTGGIGTTIFYIVGSLLVIGAAIIIVTRRRMNSGK